MKVHETKAFDFAHDLTKQLITLSTAMIALTVTFSKEIVGGVEDSSKYILVASWVVFIVSIVCGLFTLMGLTGNLDPIPRKKSETTDGPGAVPIKQEPTLTINSRNVLTTARWQVWTFLVALVITGWYGCSALGTPESVGDSEGNYMIVREWPLVSDTTNISDTLYLIRR